MPLAVLNTHGTGARNSFRDQYKWQACSSMTRPPSLLQLRQPPHVLVAASRQRHQWPAQHMARGVGGVGDGGKGQGGGFGGGFGIGGGGILGGGRAATNCTTSTGLSETSCCPGAGDALSPQRGSTYCPTRMPP
eukprot:6866919-Prymnesium_polylepis.3